MHTVDFLVKQLLPFKRRYKEDHQRDAKDCGAVGCGVQKEIEPFPCFMDGETKATVKVRTQPPSLSFSFLLHNNFENCRILPAQTEYFSLVCKMVPTILKKSLGLRL